MPGVDCSGGALTYCDLQEAAVGRADERRTVLHALEVHVGAPTSIVTDVPRPGRGSDYADLLRRIKATGLMDLRRGHYIVRIAVTGVLLAGCWATFVVPE